MSYWYIRTDDNGNYICPEYLNADDGMRSYGYFFENGKQVPYSFVPTSDVTIYAKWADYSEVAGTYYVKTSTPGRVVYIDLLSNGTMRVVEGASVRESLFSYDGTSVIMYATSLSRLKEGLTEEENAIAQTSYFNYKAVIDGNELIVVDNTYFISKKSELVAVKYQSDFVYGTYFDSQGNKYVFNLDGTGVMTIGETNEAFEYEFVDDNLIELHNLVYDMYVDCVYGENGYLESIGQTNVGTLNEFAGTWERNSTNKEEYVFDGNDMFTYTSYYYDKVTGNKVVVDSMSGYYFPDQSGNKATLEGGVTVTLENGALTVANGTYVRPYYAQNSFVGTWNYFNIYENIQITLYGIDYETGIGDAKVVYSNENVNELKYQAIKSNNNSGIEIYNNDMMIAQLYFNGKTETLSGLVYSLSDGGYRTNATFCRKDVFAGEWLSDSEDFEKLTFNGYGFYDVKGTSATLAVNGRLVIDGTTVRYTVESNGKATFTYNGKDYVLSHNRITDTIEATVGNDTVGKLTRKDEWASLTLKATSSGSRYTFNGAGKLTNGKVTVVTQDETQTYSYEINNDVLIITEANVKIVKDATQNAYVLYSLTDDQIDTLMLETGFEGDWYFGLGVGAMSFGMAGLDGTVTGSFDGDPIQLTYVQDEDNGAYMKLDLVSEKLYFYKINETIVIGQENYLYGSIIGIKADEVDDWCGTYYTISEEEGDSIEFDGLGDYEGITGTVMISYKNGLSEAFAYTVRDDGVPVIKQSRNVQYLFVECEPSADAFIVSGKYYNFVQTDALYLATVTVTQNTPETDDDVVYTFDGIGTAKKGTVEYEYTIVDVDTKLKLYYVELNWVVGNTKYWMVVDYSSKNLVATVQTLDRLYETTITDDNGTETEDDDVVYSFNGIGSVTTSDGKEYTYEITNTDTENTTLTIELNDGIRITTVYVNYSTNKLTKQA